MRTRAARTPRPSPRVGRDRARRGRGRSRPRSAPRRARVAGLRARRSRPRRGAAARPRCRRAALSASSRLETRSATCLSAPRSRGPSASNSVSLPRRASDPTSVNASVRSMTCMPRWLVTKSAIGSRSATQRATWSRVSGVTGRQDSQRLLPPVDRALELLLGHPRATLDVQPPGLVVELLLGAPSRPVRAGAQTASAAGPPEPVEEPTVPTGLARAVEPVAEEADDGPAGFPGRHRRRAGESPDERPAATYREQAGRKSRGASAADRRSGRNCRSSSSSRWCSRSSSRRSSRRST